MRCLAIWLLLSAAAFGQTAISNLPNTTTAEPSDRTAVWMVLDDTSANQTRKINLRQLNLFTDVRKTTGAITAGGNTWSDPVLKDFVRAGQWIVVNAYTTNAEMRLITNVTVNTITVHRAFVRSHSIGSTVVIADSAERNVKWWGAKGDKTTNDSPAIQAAVDDFDTEILASRESRGNNLFFPPGEYVIGSMIRLPIITPYATSRQSISGHNATLITNSYNGPFFASRYSGTHTGANNSPTLEDSTQSWATNSLVGGFVFNKSDLTPSPLPAQSLYSSGTITANTGTTVTATLGDFGSDQDWDTGDSYVLTVPSSKWTFHNLHFRDDTAGFATAGNAHVFDWSLFRMVIHNCSFSTFDAVILSDDRQNDLRQYIQSPRITNNIFDSCRYIIRASKGWDVLFAGNLTDSCSNVIHFVNIDSAALIQGQIQNNTAQGAGPGTPFHIRGPRALVFSSNYFESNNSGSEPYLRLNDGQQPRGVTIMGNRFELFSTQEQDADYFPIAVVNYAEGVTIMGNETSGNLIDGQQIQQTINGINEGWFLAGNHTFFAQSNTSFERSSRGQRVLQRMGYVKTDGNGATNVDFGNGAPLLSAIHAGIGSAIYIEAKIHGVNEDIRPNAAAQAAFHIAGLFRHQVITTQNLQQTGSTQLVTPTINDGESAEWTAGFAITTDEDTIVSADHTTETLTATAHGLANDDLVYLTGADLPLGLKQNRPYFVMNATADTLQLSLHPGPAPTAVPFSDNGTGSQVIHKEDIEIVVTGEATGPNDDVDWAVDAEVSILLDTPGV